MSFLGLLLWWFGWFSGFVSVVGWFWLVMFVRFSSSAVFWVLCGGLFVGFGGLRLIAACIGRLFFDCLVMGDLLVWVS